MLTHGSDRARRAGDKVILQSAISKGWTPRTPKSTTHSEFPGTAVLWGDDYYEVIEASPLSTGGVRYVLAAWRDDHTIRTFEHYDAASEALRLADHERARRQRQRSVLSRLSGIVLGHLPGPVQLHLEHELGVRAPRMTIVSCITPLVLLGIAVFLHVEATIRQEPSPIPALLWLILELLALESGVRFFVAMSQGRPMGSMLGTLAYWIYLSLSPKRDRLPSMIARGDSIAFTPPEEDVELRGSYEMKEPLLTLLTPADQARLAERFGFDYRRTASSVAWIILVCAALGAVTSKSPLAMLIAAAVAVEQVIRLLAFKRGPAASMLRVLVRVFVRDLLA